MSPAAPRKPCRQPGCSKLGTTPYCEEHTHKKQVVEREQRIKYDNDRGTSASRGYNYRWSKSSKLYRENNPLCVMCEAKGKLTLVQCVDHVQPVSGPDDPLFWQESNWQSLCNTCHNIKSEAEGNRYGNNERKNDGRIG